ncbi:MAG: EAL domain-containing protein [Nitratireductor sp.]|nr:EAL domain-containing protein [Nitratireductor sp.]MCC0021843.1 EAL domain-containing protein [Nitratireductor sp.]
MKYRLLEKHGAALPLEIYDSVVRSLYGDVPTFVVGKAASCLAMFLIAYQTGSFAIWLLAASLSLVGVLRLISVVRFKTLASKHEVLDYNSLKSAEFTYLIWAATYVTIMGCICLVSMMVSENDTSHMVAITATLANVMAISGRNFASPRVVNWQTVGVSVPLLAGLLFFGNTYHTLLALFLLPFMMSIHTIAKRLRRMLFDEVFSAMENRLIAERFKVALQNASHGMAMIDADGHFVVANERFDELLALPKNFELIGKTFEDLEGLSRLGWRASVDGDNVVERLHHCLLEGQKTRIRFVRADGATIEASLNPMEEGAGVIVVEDISEQVKSENEIRQLANFDPLTHLPNRRHFATMVEQVCGSGEDARPYSLFFVDLDNFKDINDSLGHSIGDKLLCAASLRMKSCLPQDGLICRFGGDEFVMIMPDLVDRRDINHLANRLIEEVSKPILINGSLIIVGTSVGIALCPENGNNLDQLLKMADVALYDAKNKGRGESLFYSEQLGSEIRQRRQMEVELRRALERGQLSVYYQPLVDIRTNRVSTCEALVRWHHPERGMISPALFIPMAEEIGIISKIGKFVLETAARECLQWPADVRVAVNVSSLQFRQSDVVEDVSKALSMSGLPANRLEIEVTESAMVEDLAETSRVLRTLSQSGVRISLDDFGTGFSSLSYLHQLPLDKVKIDRSFVESIRKDERSLILLSGVTRMAADLGLLVIVEGVEEVEQLNILKEKVHLDQVQGYLFGKPMPSQDIRAFIAENIGTQADGLNRVRSA